MPILTVPTEITSKPLPEMTREVGRVTAARQDKALPPIPEDVRDIIYSWLGTESNTKAITPANVRLVQDFYRSIGYRKDWSKPIYRGFKTTLANLTNLLDGGSMTLKPRVAESWSMNPVASIRFMRPQSDWGELHIGVMFSQPKPRPGSIVIDAPKFYKTYAKTEHDIRGGKYHDSVEYMKTNFTAECELILTQQCRQCTLSDLEVLALPWAKWGSGIPEPYRELLEKYGFTGNLLGSDYVQNPNEYEARESGNWMCTFDGNQLNPFMMMPSFRWPPGEDDLAKFRKLAAPLMNNRPAPLSGDCPAIDIGRR